MKRNNIILLTGVFFAVCMLTILHDAAEAARLGGGRSFGSRPSYQRSAPAPSPTPPQISPSRPSQQEPIPGAAPSPMGRWGGMLGGMVMGSLIGSLLFGGSHAGAPGLLDLAIIGGGLFLIIRFLRARRMAADSPAAAGPLSFERGPSQEWGASGYDPAAEATTFAAEQPALPPGFDEQEFLRGAKAIYIRMQASWDRRDLDDIRQFTSPEVFNEIQSQAQADPTPGKTELLLINPRILEVRESDGQTIASVLYDVMMRENREETTKQVRELWHFSRDAGKPSAFWVLEGIQQVEG
jgi:predicted lipid-binding transport protein (Tim44 family)